MLLRPGRVRPGPVLRPQGRAPAQGRRGSLQPRGLRPHRPRRPRRGPCGLRPGRRRPPERPGRPLRPLPPGPLRRKEVGRPRAARGEPPPLAAERPRPPLAGPHRAGPGPQGRCPGPRRAGPALPRQRGQDPVRRGRPRGRLGRLRVGRLPREERPGPQAGLRRGPAPPRRAHVLLALLRPGHSPHARVRVQGPRERHGLVHPRHGPGGGGQALRRDLQPQDLRIPAPRRRAGAHRPRARRRRVDRRRGPLARALRRLAPRPRLRVRGPQLLRPGHLRVPPRPADLSLLQEGAAGLRRHAQGPGLPRQVPLRAQVPQVERRGGPGHPRLHRVLRFPPGRRGGQSLGRRRGSLAQAALQARLHVPSRRRRDTGRRQPCGRRRARAALPRGRPVILLPRPRPRGRAEGRLLRRSLQGRPRGRGRLLRPRLDQGDRTRRRDRRRPPRRAHRQPGELLHRLPDGQRQAQELRRAIRPDPRVLPAPARRPRTAQPGQGPRRPGQVGRPRRRRQARGGEEGLDPGQARGAGHRLSRVRGARRDQRRGRRRGSQLGHAQALRLLRRREPRRPGLPGAGGCGRRAGD